MKYLILSFSVMVMSMNLANAEILQSKIATVLYVVNPIDGTLKTIKDNAGNTLDSNEITVKSGNIIQFKRSSVLYVVNSKDGTVTPIKDASGNSLGDTELTLIP
jgi:hypothetical protein